MSPSPRLVLLGAGGHGRVLLALATAAGLTVDAVSDPQLSGSGTLAWRGLSVLVGDGSIEAEGRETIALINGIGQLAGSWARANIFGHFRALGFDFPVMLHPAAWVAPSVRLGQGVQVMAGAVVQPDVSIGDNSVINTGATLDHDCQISHNVHIAPGAVLCGGVTVGPGAFIGSGATVIEGIDIGAGAIVGAGTVVLRDVGPGAVVLGVAGKIRP